MAVVQTEAFKLADLAAMAKEAGLPIAEDAAKQLTSVVFKWAEQSCAIKGGLFVMGVTLLPILDTQVEALENKIAPAAGV